MKIAILVQMFLPQHLGGVEIATYNIASQLAKNGHEVHVITVWDSGLAAENIERGFFIHRLKLPRIKSIGVLIFWLKILFTLKKINPDSIHVQGLTIAMPAYLAGKFLKKTYVVCGHGFDLYFSWKFKRVISKLVLRDAHKVVALTKNMKNDMQKIHHREILVIPNGIDTEKFDLLPDKESIRKEIGLSNGDRVIIFAGNLRPVKGVEFLLSAMDTVIQKEANAKLILVGGGSQIDYLKKTVAQLHLEKYVIFTGELLNEEVLLYLAASDIFVLPSLSEGFSIVTLEAMVCGLPVIATEVGVLPEIIENGVNGFLVKSKDSKAISENLLKLLGDDTLRVRISGNNKKKAKDYSWTGIVRKLEEAYEKP